jgi:hypothetical protein
MGLDVIGQDWVPDACSLSPAGRQAQVADFGELFSGAVLKVERPGTDTAATAPAPRPAQRKEGRQGRLGPGQ